MDASAGLVSFVVFIAGVFVSLALFVVVLRAGLAPVQEELAKIALELQTRSDTLVD